MTALLCAIGVVVLFWLVLAWEAQPGQLRLLQPAGLIGWLVSGNWPAKVGAGLMIVGTGALLRYLMVNMDLPPTVKLGTGVAASTALALGSGALRGNPRRRAIHLALGGTSLGIAYLTAYSAYGFFNFVDGLQALGALFAVACAGTAFALVSRAQSIAVLSMLGAFIAPAFALADSSPGPVYGYYAAASTLTLVMVWLRGWRALAHLSFLFTLAGGLFFAWTQKFYAPQHYAQMQPLLLVLVALHLAMPLAESAETARPVSANAWLRRFDLGYFLVLPLTVLVLTLALAPNAAQEGALGLLEMAGLWLVTAVAQHLRFRVGVMRYVVVAALFAMLAGLLWLGDPPYFLVAALVSCVLLALAPVLGLGGRLDGPLISAALASTACYLLQAMAESVNGTPFVNMQFARHALLVAALAGAGVGLRRRGSGLAPIFLMLAGAWLLVACARELIRLNLEHLTAYIHLAMLGISAAYAVALRWYKPKLSIVLLLGGVLFYTGMASARHFTAESLAGIVLAAHVVFSVLAALAGRHAEAGESVAGIARSLLPLLLFPFAVVFAEGVRHDSQSAIVMTLLVTAALSAALQARWLLPESRLWPNTLSPVGFVVFSAWLFYQTLFHIERDGWAVAYELITLSYLLMTLGLMPVSHQKDARLFTATGVTAVVTVGIAMVMRLFGPPRTMTILDLNQVLLPAALSLCIAVIGAATAWWAKRIKSRGLWGTGALLMATAAAKLFFLDFGSLGELGNIVAMLASGSVFMVVAWLAPIPPKPEPTPQPKPKTRPQDGTSRPLPPRSATMPPSPAASAREPVPSQASETAGAAPCGERSEPSPAPTVEATRDAKPAIAAKPSGATGRQLYIPPPDEDVQESTGRPWLWILGGLFVIFLFVRNAGHDAAPAVVAARPQPAPPTQVPVAQPMQPPVTAVRVVDACSRFAEQLPRDYVVYAVGVNGYGRGLGYEERISGREMRSVDAYVHQPLQRVVLALGAHDPTIWNIHVTPGTLIAGVILSGHSTGSVSGLPTDVPVLKAATSDQAPCGSFFITPQSPQAATAFMQRALGRAVDTVFMASGSRADIGITAPPGQAFHQSTPSLMERTAPPQGSPVASDNSMNSLLRDGKVRLAQSGDITAWIYKYQARYGQLPSVLASMPTRRDSLKVYVVTKETPLPQDISPLHVFIVPNGVPSPTLEGRATATVLTSEPVACAGPLCNGSIVLSEPTGDKSSTDMPYKQRKERRLPRFASTPQ